MIAISHKWVEEKLDSWRAEMRRLMGTQDQGNWFRAQMLAHCVEELAELNGEVGAAVPRAPRLEPNAQAEVRQAKALDHAHAGAAQNAPLGCINCGAVNEGGYQTEEVGSFCAQCWQLLEQHFSPAARALREPLELSVRMADLAVTGAVSFHHGEWAKVPAKSRRRHAEGHAIGFDECQHPDCAEAKRLQAAARSALPPQTTEEKEDARVAPSVPRVETTGSTAEPSPGNATMCLAQEWQRDGRGVWAMRACRYYEKHGKPHDFGSWRYNVHPPAALPPPQMYGWIDERQADAALVLDEMADTRLRWHDPAIGADVVTALQVDAWRLRLAAALPRVPEPDLKALIAEMLRLYAVPFTDPISREVCIDSWAQQCEQAINGGPAIETARAWLRTTIPGMTITYNDIEILRAALRAARAGAEVPPLPFTHWSKDPLVPYADCRCVSCQAARVSPPEAPQ